MKKIVLLSFIYSSFAMAEQNIFPVHEVQNLLGYGQLEFLKPNKKNIFMRYTMKNKGIKTYSLQDGCYQKDKVDNCVSEMVYLESSQVFDIYAYRRRHGRGFGRKFFALP